MPPMRTINDIDPAGAREEAFPDGSALQVPEDLSFLFEEQMPGVGDYAMGPDGNMALVALEDDYMPAIGSPGHTENLAERLEDSALASIASDLLDNIEDDIESRKPWADRFRRGMEMMGLIPDETDDGPFPGSATAVMPIISESTVQFWARALAEQVPPDGPVKGKVLGKAHQALVQRADRVATYMNHDMMVIDQGWYEDHSRMLFALPVQGSTFKKTYRDHALGRNRGEFVAAEDFIANNTFTSLDDAPRYTHRLWRTRNEVRKLQVAGIWRDIDLDEPSSEERPEATDIKIEVQDADPGGEGSSDARHEIYEVYCELDIPGFEELDQFGRPTGVALPYIVTIDRHSEKVLAIYRNWKEPDPLKRPRVCFTKYDFVPGFGFYGLGFFHLIGGLQEAATGALRVMLDGAATASIQGGFISKDASLKDQSLIVEPGVYKQVDASYEDLQRAFYTPPYKEPSAALFQVMGFLVARAEKFSATTETMTGSQDPKGSPVGSIAQLIEQGGKVFSTVHRGLHRSLGIELRKRYDLIQEYLPVEGYPWDVDGAHEGLLAEDFAPGVTVLPVSDPNIFTQAQRVAQAQAVYDLAQQNPQLIKLPVALRRVLESINVPDIDELMVEAEPPPPMDPVSEIQALLRGEPVQAYPDQPHVAYLQHYAAFMANPQFGGSPQIAQHIGPAAVALIGQRLAYAWATHARALGAQAPMLPPPMLDEDGQATGQATAQADPMQASGMPGQQPSLPVMPPELIAQAAAQIAPQMAQVPGLPSMEAQAQDQAAQAQAQATQAKTQADIQARQADMQLKAEAQQADMALRQQEQAFKLELQKREADIKLQLAQVEADMKAQIEQIKMASKAQIEEQKANVALAQASQKMQAEDDRLTFEQARTAQDMQQSEQQMMIDAAAQSAKIAQDQRANEQAMQLKERESQARTSAMKAQAKAKPKPGKKTS